MWRGKPKNKPPILYGRIHKGKLGWFTVLVYHISEKNPIASRSQHRSYLLSEIRFENPKK